MTVRSPLVYDAGIAGTVSTDNLQPYSNITDALWGTSGSSSITDNQDVNPVDGIQNVPIITLGDGEQIFDDTDLPAGQTLTGSAWFWAAGDDIGKTVRLYIRDATNSAFSTPNVITLTATATRHSVTYTPAANAIRGGVRIYGAPSVSLTTLRVFGAQLELGGNLGGYISTQRVWNIWIFETSYRC